MFFAPSIPRHLDALLKKSVSLGGFAEKNAGVCLEALARALSKKSHIFGIEPWHPLHPDVPLDQPGEMLLRLKDEKGEAISPYPCVMAFYNHNLAAEFDLVLVLCALQQFRESDERQISINISGKSLRDAEFIKVILPAIESMTLAPDEKIIFEIHESAPSEIMSPRVLDLCRALGIGFAIDDVGLSMNDIFRLSEFESFADFVKLDRKSVNVEPDNKNLLDQLITLLATILPRASIVAEGIQSVQHAATLTAQHPTIKYAQGLYLPPREQFAKDWAAVRKAA